MIRRNVASRPYHHAIAPKSLRKPILSYPLKTGRDGISGTADIEWISIDFVTQFLQIQFFVAQRFALPAAKSRARNERRFLLSECMQLLCTCYRLSSPRIKNTSDVNFLRIFIPRRVERSIVAVRSRARSIDSYPGWHHHRVAE